MVMSGHSVGNVLIGYIICTHRPTEIETVYFGFVEEADVIESVSPTELGKWIGHSPSLPVHLCRVS